MSPYPSLRFVSRRDPKQIRRCNGPQHRMPVKPHYLLSTFLHLASITTLIDQCYQQMPW